MKNVKMAQKRNFSENLTHTTTFMRHKNDVLAKNKKKRQLHLMKI